MTEILCGIYKLQEEMCELGAVLAKFGPFPNGEHPSPEYTTQRTLHDHMCEEIADVYAALNYFVTRNELRVNADRIFDKERQFHAWGMTGLAVPDV